LVFSPEELRNLVTAESFPGTKLVSPVILHGTGSPERLEAGAGKGDSGVLLILASSWT